MVRRISRAEPMIEERAIAWRDFDSGPELRYSA